MAHFAKINENNIVEQVIVIHNNELLDNGIESQEKGKQFCADLFGGTWVQTSYNTIGNQHPEGRPLHKNYAGIGYHWDGVGFYAPQPFPSWSKNEDTYIWEAPIAYPTDGKVYEWNEAAQKWDEVSFE